jgi:predicted RNA-binding Zn-ribbon protein involved in translation (DUF1610 family)
MSFTRKKEDFICEHCGIEVIGTGYTNHCPKCLWSKHVDVDPGDRAATCGGMMEPVNVEIVGREQKILYRCVKCGFERKNKVGERDDFDVVVKIAKKIADSR